MLSRRASFLVAVVSSIAAACSSNTSSSGHTGGHTGPALKGEKCVVDNDCSANDSVCLPGQSVCTGALDGDAFMTECDSTTVGTCPGLECATFTNNKQGKKGICTLGCTNDASCGGAGVCIHAVQGQSICLTACPKGDECQNGYACIKDPTSGKSICFVSN